MTTKVTVHANHGWPVYVTPILRDGSGIGTPSRVAAGDTREFHVHSGQDLLIRELQPDEASE